LSTSLKALRWKEFSKEFASIVGIALDECIPGRFYRRLVNYRPRHHI